MLTLLHTKIEEIFEYAKLSTQEFEYNANDPDHVLIMSLYCTIIEASDTCLFLYRNDKNMMIEVIARDMLEALLDLKNLMFVDKYSEHMLCAQLKQTKNILNQDFQKRFEHDEKKQAEIEAQRNQAETEYEKRKKKFPPLRVNEKFDKADISEVYSVYRYLCLFSHNNINALEMRHLIGPTDNKKLVCIKKYTNSEKAALLYYIYMILITAFKHIQIYYKQEKSIISEEVAKKSDIFQQIIKKIDISI